MDLIDLEDDTIDAEVMDSLAVTMDDFRVREITTNTHIHTHTHTHTHTHAHTHTHTCTHKHSHMHTDTLVCLFKVPQTHFWSSR